MTTPTQVGYKELALFGTGTGAPAVFKYIAVGTSTGQGEANTKLAVEHAADGMSRVSADTTETFTTTFTDDTMRWIEKFTATGAVHIKEAGVFNDAVKDAGEMMMVGDLSPSADMAKDDTLTITMTCQIKAD